MNIYKDSLGNHWLVVGDFLDEEYVIAYPCDESGVPLLGRSKERVDKNDLSLVEL